MALSERLAFIITADPANAIRGFESVGSAAERELGKAESKVDKLGTNLTRFGAGALAFAGVAGGGLYKLAQSASAVNEQIDSSNVIFKANAGEVQQWSKGLASSFGISEKAGLTAANAFGSLFVGVGVAGDEAATMSQALIETAGDLASFKDLAGGSEEALEKLRAGIVGEAEPLRSLGIFLTEASVKAKAMELGLVGATGELSEGAKVQARYALILEQSQIAQGNFGDTAGSLANQQRIANAEAENAKAAFGQGVVGAFESAGKAATGLLADLNSLNPGAAATVGQVAAYGTAAIGAVGGVSLLAGQTIKMRDRFTTLGADGATRQLNAFGKVAGGIAAAGAILATAQALDELRKELDDGVPAAGAMQEQLIEFAQTGRVGSEIAKLFGQDLERLGDDAKNAREGLLSFSGVGFERQRNAKEDIEALDQALVQLVQAGHVEEAQQALARFAEAQEHVNPDDLRAGTDGYRDALARVRAEADAAGESTEGLTEDLDSATAAQEDAAAAAEEAAAQLEAERQAVDDLSGALFGLESADIAYEESLNRIEDAQGSVTEAQGALNDAIAAHGPNSLHAMAATEGLSRANLDLRSAELNGAEAARALDQALADEVTQVRGNTDASRTLKGELEALKARFPELTAVIQPYIDRLNGIPASKTTRADILLDEAGRLEAEAKLRDLTRDRQVRLLIAEQRLNEVGGAAFGAGFFGGGRASGGPVAPGEVRLVGEQGPELVRFRQSGVVVPAATSAAEGRTRRAGASGDITINVPVITNADPHEIARAVAWAMKTSGR